MPGTTTPKLAINGGTPVRSTLLPYGRQSLDDADIQAVNEVLRSDWLTTGPKVGEFEEAIASYVGAKYAVAFSSGTAALHGAAHAAGLKPGDEAITTPLTFCATSNCVLYQGARPVFADILPNAMTLDPEKAAAAITPATKVILPVDYAGTPADLDAFLNLAEKHRLTIIEDACHALGAEYKRRKVGSISHMTVFSFHPVKHITTGEGGMVTTNDAELARKLRTFRTHGIDSDPRMRQERGLWQYDMVELGYNYRLPDIACALGISQLKRIDANVERRRAIADRYNKAFSALAQVTVAGVPDDVRSAWHLYPIRIGGGMDRAEVFRALRAENIGVNVHYIPVHMHPYYRNAFGYKAGDYPVAEQVYSGLISLPMFHSMADTDVEDVVAAVTKVLDSFSNRQE